MHLICINPWTTWQLSWSSILALFLVIRINVSLSIQNAIRTDQSDRSEARQADLPVAMLPHLLRPECHLQPAACGDARGAAGVATTQVMQAAYLKHRCSGWQEPSQLGEAVP